MKKFAVLKFIMIFPCALILLSEVCGYAQETAVRAYVTNFGEKTVSVIDTGSNTKIADILTGVNPRGESTIWNFDKEAVGKLPTGWKVEATGQRGELATWEVVVSDSKDGKKTQVLGMTKVNDDFGGTFNICWTDSVQFKDGEIEVHFKAIRGVEDQGGGPIWRVQDEDNYYIARANPLENNFRIYYVKDGVRRTLDSARVKVSSKQWHTIKIVHKGKKIKGYLNGEKFLEYEDDTFPEVGGVGLWTKADAVTEFDDFSVNRKKEK